MKTIALCAVGAAMAWTVFAQKSQFDAPASKPITIRSEAERGFNASRLIDFGKVHPMLTALEVSQAVHDIDRLNEQNNTDTDAFQIGLALGAIVRMSIFAYDPEEFAKAKTLSKPFVDRVRAVQQRMGMSDEQLDLLFGTWTLNKMREMTEP